MSQLEDAILDALVKYDEVCSNNDTGTAEEQGDNAEVAAHECVAEIREAFEEEPTEPAVVNLHNYNNPIAQLHERAQQIGCDAPIYDFEVSGVDHCPEIECTCRFELISQTAMSTTKQKAKRKVSALVLRVLLTTQRKERLERRAK